MSQPSQAVGVRFCPSDQELITHFLLNKAKGLEVPWINVIPEFDLYGDQAPWEICQGNQESMFVFTKLKKAGKKRISRSAACGEWHGNSSAVVIKDRQTNRVIGLKKHFTFKVKKSNQEASYSNTDGGSWIMREYSLSSDSDLNNGSIKFPDYVVCQILKSNHGARKY